MTAAGGMCSHNHTQHRTTDKAATVKQCFFGQGRYVAQRSRRMSRSLDWPVAVRSERLRGVQPASIGPRRQVQWAGGGPHAANVALRLGTTTEQLHHLRTVSLPDAVKALCFSAGCAHNTHAMLQQELTPHLSTDCYLAAALCDYCSS